MRACLRWVVLAAMLTAALAPRPTLAAEPLPVPPCAGSPVPAVPGPDAPPTLALWHTADLPQGWAPAACSGLAAPTGGVVIALSGSFHHAGEMSDLLAKLGAVSTHTRIVYWNVADAAWRPVLADATALASTDPDARRPDFTLAEMQPGARLHLLYDDDGPPGPVVYETEIREAGPDSILMVSHNVTAMRLMGMSIADPGMLSSMLSVRRSAPGVYDYYSLSEVSLAALAAAVVPDAAHLNRAVGSFRFLAGIPGDQEPPAVPK